MSPDVALIGPYPEAGQRHAGRSGVASYTANLAHALADRGVRPVVVAPVHDGEPAISADGPVRIERRFRRGAGALPRASAAAVATGAPVVHLQFEVFLYGGPIALAGLAPALGWLRARRVGPVVTMHQVLDPSTIDQRAVALHRFSVPPVLARAGLRAVSQTIGRLSATTIVHEHPFSSHVPRSVVVPHGVETAHPPAREAARAGLALDDRLTVLCFGFVAPYKGLEAALAAVEPVSDRVLLVIAGGEHPRLVGSERYANELRERWGDAARFTGWVPESDVSRWFTACDLALLPYPQPFASSGALALALAHRAPVLLSNALAECIGAPDDVAVACDPHSLRRRLLELAEQPDELKSLAGWADALAEDRSWTSVAARHARIYEEVIDGSRSARRSVRNR